jgi:hypothetical protein
MMKRREFITLLGGAVQLLAIGVLIAALTGGPQAAMGHSLLSVESVQIESGVHAYNSMDYAAKTTSASLTPLNSPEKYRGRVRRAKGTGGWSSTVVSGDRPSGPVLLPRTKFVPRSKFVPRRMRSK